MAAFLSTASHVLTVIPRRDASSRSIDQPPASPSLSWQTDQLRRSVCAAGQPACTQVSRCIGLSGSDREFPTLTGPDRARNGHVVCGRARWSAPRRPGPRHRPATYALRGCHGALLAASEPALASCSHVAAGGNRCLLMAIRGHLGGTRPKCVGRVLGGVAPSHDLECDASFQARTDASSPAATHGSSPRVC